MKNKLRCLWMASLAALLSGCMISQEDRMKDHRMKCEMRGFLPGSPEFAHCVKNQEGRYTVRASMGMSQGT